MQVNALWAELLQEGWKDNTMRLIKSKMGAITYSVQAPN
jgi:hypothetical protein